MHILGTNAARVACCLTAVLFAAACGGPDTLVDGDLAFVNVNVLPMDQEQVLEDQTVIIADGRVVAMASADDIGPEENVEVVEGDGLYLMPGLTEMHGHLPNPRMSDMDIKNLLFLYVANGVTTVRGMQGDESHFRLREQINHGLLVGPQLFLASVSMNGERVPTAEIAEQRVREYKVAGYDLVKLHEDLTLDTYDSMARTADEVGIPFGGHVSDQVGLRHALAAGQISIDHLDNYIQALVPAEMRPAESPGLRGVGALMSSVDESVIPELVRLTVDAGAWVVPTMVLWETAFFTDRSSAEVLPDRPGSDVYASRDGCEMDAGRGPTSCWVRHRDQPPGGSVTTTNSSGVASRRGPDRARDGLAADLQRARLCHASRDGAVRRCRDDAV